MKYKNLRLRMVGLFFLLLSFSLKSQNVSGITQDSLSYYNKLLSEKEMKEDLQVLMDIRKNVNSGLYQYRSKKQIDSIFDWAFKEIKKPQHIIDFYKIMLQLADFEGSVHNYTEVDSELLAFLQRQKSFFPYALIYIEGQIIFDGKNAQIPSGSRILGINGVSDTLFMKSFYKYFPADGFTKTKKRSAGVERAFDLYYLLEYGLTDKYVVEYLAPKSKSSKIAIFDAVGLEERKANHKNRYSAPVTNLLDFKTQSPYSFEMPKPSVGRLNLRWFGMVTGEEDPNFEGYVRFLDSVFQVLDQKNIKNLIIDVRNNPGGSDPTFEQPVMYLTDHSFKENVQATIIFDPDNLPYEKYFWGISTTEPTDSISLKTGKAFVKDRFPVYNDGVSYQNQKYNPTYYPKSPKFTGKLYLLINENVASAASHFVSLVKAYATNLTIVGVETVGGYYIHNGHIPLVFELPNSKIKTQFSIVNVIQDAPEKPDQPEGRGIIPDYEVWPTLNDFFKHKDSQLEFALDLIEK